MGIDFSNYSPDVLKKVVFAGSQFTSFANGSAALKVLADLKVDTKQVERVSEKIGTERVEQRTQAVEEFLALPLMERCTSPIPNQRSQKRSQTV